MNEPKITPVFLINASDGLKLAKVAFDNRTLNHTLKETSIFIIEHHYHVANITFKLIVI